MKTLYYRVTGRVQGVGYRYFTREIALKHAINGWVRNREDGSVEGILQGRGTDIGNVLARLAEGPAFSTVKDIETTHISSDEYFSDFTIRFP